MGVDEGMGDVMDADVVCWAGDAFAGGEKGREVVKKTDEMGDGERGSSVSLAVGNYSPP